MRVLLIDADLYAHQAAAAVERAVDWSEPGADAAEDDRLWTLHADPAEARAVFESLLARITEPLKPDRLTLAFSEGETWRRRLLPSYKANRAGRRKPLALPALRAWLRRDYDARAIPGLEADDVIGLLLTEPPRNEERICLTRDKDLRGVPGLHADETGGVERVTPAEADRWHLLQALGGDPADGYGGCPGVGPETARAFLDDPYELHPARHTLSRGARRGQTETRWEKRPTRDLWRGMVSLYARAGLTEADALVQAQVARILRHGEFEAETGRPIPWRPAMPRQR